MLSQLKVKFLLATVVSFALINSVKFHLPTSNQFDSVEIGIEKAEAKKSGGRSGGGSFKRSSPSSRSSSPSRSTTTSPSNSNSSRPSSKPSPSPVTSPGNTRPTTVSPRNSGSSGGNTTIVVPNNSSSSDRRSTSAATYSQNSNWVANLFLFGLFLIFGLITFAVFFFILKALMSSNNNNNTVANAIETERDNDIVTISKLQIALLATATGVQTELSLLSLNADTETETGLVELLQESALVLLRNSDRWSHVSSSSESINIENAESAFNKISLSERSKFSHESLVNVSGRISSRTTTNSNNVDLGSCLVVTLLAGTADDKPLFGEIRSVDELKEALEKLASVRSDYLMKFELLWTPQAEGESLTYDEMLSEYAAMYQLV
ncbi:DUF1517 domain-containing protein [Oscillatoria salina]|uniref:DUF1517 domain-containing protein n=1 Tax=Oscillatoria salina TaxID=331517 RepID=UPI0013BB3180|nr:DUF1517 domain-containing protein [Oscillatoria salina]MBZ8178947.1 DUF1517 domain-containing protein [Oscillatoria salina IIICB1]NET89404.1 DUF1517 domain-containing protein [Kamptonema sp. SIO1D9]